MEIAISPEDVKQQNSNEWIVLLKGDVIEKYLHQVRVEQTGIYYLQYFSRNTNRKYASHWLVLLTFRRNSMKNPNWCVLQATAYVENVLFY